MGANIYYSDTHSIVTDIALPSSILDSTSVGKLKSEYKVGRGYFISLKTYSLINSDGSVVKIARGLTGDTLNENDYIKMYRGNSINKGIKKFSTTNYYKGTVLISEDTITLNPVNYTKRVKRYNHNIWVDTKFIVYDKNMANLHDTSVAT